MEENNYETSLCVVKSKKRAYIFLILVLMFSAVGSNVYFNHLSSDKSYAYNGSGEDEIKFDDKISGDIDKEIIISVEDKNYIDNELNNDLQDDDYQKTEIDNLVDKEDNIKNDVKNEDKNSNKNFEDDDISISGINYFENNRKLDKNKPMVAITFDDGPDPVITPKLLKLLNKYDSRASFFDIGYLMEDYPEVVKAELDSGCDVGSQAYSHINLDSLTSSEIKEEVKKSNDIFKEITGQNLKYIRAPYGNANSQTRKSIDYPLIHWCVDSEDWKTRDADKIIEEVRKTKNLDGKIIIFHAIYDSTYETMEILIPELINEGYQLVTVSELAQYKGYNFEKGKVYYQFN